MHVHWNYHISLVWWGWCGPLTQDRIHSSFAWDLAHQSGRIVAFGPSLRVLRVVELGYIEKIPKTPLRRRVKTVRQHCFTDTLLHELTFYTPSAGPSRSQLTSHAPIQDLRKGYDVGHHRYCSWSFLSLRTA